MIISFSKRFLVGVTCTALLLLFNYLPASAQKTWSFGPEIGVSFSKFVGDTDEQQFKTGLLAGGHVTHSIWNTFGITFKALYHQRGSQQGGHHMLIKQSRNYLEFPLMGRFFLTKSGRFRPNLFAGTSFAFLTSAKNKDGSGDYTAVSDAQWDNLNKFDLGFTGGLGLNYQITGETRLLLDTRYTHGLSDLINDPSVSMHNRGLAISLGLSFGLKR